MWRFFASVKLTIVILILLAVASVIGTLIPQISLRESVEFAKNLPPDVFRLFNALDFFDMYHSVWFRLLLGCLALNLMICSVDRFPGTWRLFSKKPRPDRNKPFLDILPDQTFSTNRHSDEVIRETRRFLEKHYNRLTEKHLSDSHYFYVEKGRFSRFGAYIVHTSILLILIGAMIGSFTGFEATVNILEGEAIDTVSVRKNMTRRHLDFKVRCDQFMVNFYENGAPKEYRSDLTFLVNGKEIEKRILRVNHPVQFRGVTFYQSSYGSIPGDTAEIDISSDKGEKTPGTLKISAGKSYSLPGTDAKFSITDIKGNFMSCGPAVQITVSSGRGEIKRFWIFKHFDKAAKMLPGPMLLSSKFDPSGFKPFTFALNKLEFKNYTGLQVNRDPGVNIVWAGCFLLIAGFYISFFTSHIRIWVRLKNIGKKTHISIAGFSSKNPVGLERELSNAVSRLKKMFL